MLKFASRKHQVLRVLCAYFSVYNRIYDMELSVYIYIPLYLPRHSQSYFTDLSLALEINRVRPRERFLEYF